MKSITKRFVSLFLSLATVIGLVVLPESGLTIKSGAVTLSVENPRLTNDRGPEQGNLNYISTKDGGYNKYTGLKEIRYYCDQKRSKDKHHNG